MRPKRPRLDPVLYIGIQRVLLTFCTNSRQPFFATAASVQIVNEHILHVATDLHVAILAYCYMPDHVHLLVEGQDDAANMLAFAHQAKQRSGFAFAQRLRKQLWQPSFHDRVLRDNDAAISVARYIVENPVRGNLVKSPADYPFLGSSQYTIEEILEAACWQP